MKCILNHFSFFLALAFPLSCSAIFLNESIFELFTFTNLENVHEILEITYKLSDFSQGLSIVFIGVLVMALDLL